MKLLQEQYNIVANENPSRPAVIALEIWSFDHRVLLLDLPHMCSKYNFTRVNFHSISAVVTYVVARFVNSSLERFLDTGGLNVGSASRPR